MLDNIAMTNNQDDKRSEWLHSVTAGDSINKISQLTRIPYATIYRRFDKGGIETDEIIAVARGYNINPVEALVKCGIITEEEAAGVTGAEALRLCSIQDIAAEIVRRNTAGIDQGTINKPIDEAAQK
nr:MAG TPA: helix-turn-helix domain protein [Caudoviricetes sp.]